MKKVLVLMLVLGMASLANASLMLTVNGLAAGPEVSINVGDTLTLGVDSTTADGFAYVDVLLGGGTFTLAAPVAGPAIGDLGSVMSADPGTTPGYLETLAQQAFAPGTAELTGNIVTIGLTCTGEGDVTVQLWDNALGFDAPAQVLTIHQVPEPATLAILGLGALLLRRK